MVIFLRDRDNGHTISLHCASYNYHNDNGATSSFTVIGKVSRDYEGGIVIIPSPETGAPHVSNITTISPDPLTDTTEISSQPMLQYFDRDVLWKSTYSSSSAQATVAAILSDNWGSGQTDTQYRATWITTDFTGTTAFVPPELDEAGFFNVAAFLQSLSDAGILIFQAVPSGRNVQLTNHMSDDNRQRIDFSNTEYDLLSESFSDTMTAKVTISRASSDEPPVWTDTTYYLFADGTFSTNASAGTRVRGKWIHLIADADETDADLAAEEFGKNSFEHSIEFRTKKVIRLGRKIQVRTTDGNVFETLITSASVNDGDDRVLYAGGNLRTTLTSYLGDASQTNPLATRRDVVALSQKAAAQSASVLRPDDIGAVSKGHLQKQIWPASGTGTWAVGDTIEVENFRKYSVYMAKTPTWAMPIFIIRHIGTNTSNSFNIFGFSSQPTGAEANSIRTLLFQAAVSMTGEKAAITLTYCHNNANSTALNINSLYGII